MTSLPVRGLARPTMAGLALAALALAPAAVLAPAADAAAPGDRVTLFDINDFHGHLSQGRALACTITDARAGLANTAMISSGDNIGGSEFASFLQEDNPTLDYLNALGLDASAVGNHEFDRGYEDLSGRVADRAEFPYLAANVFRADGSRALEPYTVVEAGDVKVAVVGAVTQSTPSLVSPGGIEGLEFRDPVDSVNQAVEELQASGTAYDVLVVSYHEGADVSAAEVGQAPETDSEVFAKIVGETTPEADAIYTAHTHKTYAYAAPVPGQDGETRPVVQTGNYGVAVSQLTLELGQDGDWDATAEGNQLLDVESAPIEQCDAAADPAYVEASQIADQAIEDAAGPAAEPVGEVAGDVTTAWDPSLAAYQDGVWTPTGPTGGSTKGDDRGSESSLSNLIADSMVWATQQDSYTGTTATIGVQNPGGVRAELWYAEDGGEGDGVVTFAEANGVVPFANNLSTVDLTGAQVKELLEDQWQRDENGEVPSRPFLALGLSSNVDYVYDSTLPERERILAITVDGEPIDPEATYTVVAASFLTEGGDNFWTFQEGTNRTDTGILDRDAFAEYLSAHEGIEPSYAQRGTEVQELQRGVQDGEGSTPIVWRFSNLESRSLGAPAIESVQVSVGEQTYEAPYVLDEATGEYAAVVELDEWYCLPAGTHDAVVTALPETGTRIPPITLEVESTGDAPAECGGEPTDPEPTDPPTGEPTDPPTGEPTEPEPTDPGAGEPTDPEPTDPGAGEPTDPGAGEPSEQPSADPTTPVVIDPTMPAGPDHGDVGAGAEHDGLARTGAEAAPYAIGAGILLVAGIAALVIRRRLGRR